MLQNYRNLQIWNTSVFSPSVSPNFSLYFWTAFLDFCVFVFVSPECPPLYYFAREPWWYCVTVFLRTDWLNVSLLLFQIWYLANWIFRSLFPNTQGAVTRFNPYEFLVTPDYLDCNFLQRSDMHVWNTSFCNNLNIPKYRTTSGQRSFTIYWAVKIWNLLDSAWPQRRRQS